MSINKSYYRTNKDYCAEGNGDKWGKEDLYQDSKIVGSEVDRYDISGRSGHYGWLEANSETNEAIAKLMKPTEKKKYEDK